MCVCVYLSIYPSIHPPTHYIANLRQECHNSKFVIFELLV